MKSAMQKNRFLIPFILVTSLFFLWGFAYGLLDVLNKHFQDTLHVSKARSAMLQAAYFGAYFLIALPAGAFMKKYGYKRGIITGLLLYALGALLFYPAAALEDFEFFVFALFIVASGLACLETAANPYVTVLGDAETAEHRLNLAQCFNGLGSFLGPLIAAWLFFSEDRSGGLQSVQVVYVVIGLLVLLVAAVFFKTDLPEIQTTDVADGDTAELPLYSQTHFVGAVIAQFFYVAAQVGIAAFFINYCTETGRDIDSRKAASLLSISLVLFTIGRFIGTALMRKVQPGILLTSYAVVNMVLCVFVILSWSDFSVYALMSIFFFESIMFPTIFAMGIKNIRGQKKKASSILIMSIVGGALVPLLMGWIADQMSTATSFWVPFACFLIVAWYGWKGHRIATA